VYLNACFQYSLPHVTASTGGAIKLVHRSIGPYCDEYKALVTLLDSKKQDVYLFKNPVPCFLEYIHNPVFVMHSVDDLNAPVLCLGCNVRTFYQMDLVDTLTSVNLNSSLYLDWVLISDRMIYVHDRRMKKTTDGYIHNGDMYV
jgi:hypothetical protein